MTAKIYYRAKDGSRKTIQAGPWYIRINKKTRLCWVTSGGYWCVISRQAAARLILGKTG